jgi:hypothetical protein
MAATATDALAATELKTRPQKPDEAAYKSNLAQAEKEHAAAQEKLVGFHRISVDHSGAIANV